jgi:hypothetical protein
MAVLLSASNLSFGQTIYFLVGLIPGLPASHHESYVLPLSKPEDIAHARDLIARGQTGTNELIRPLVGAKVARSPWLARPLTGHSTQNNPHRQNLTSRNCI